MRQTFTPDCNHFVERLTPTFGFFRGQLSARIPPLVAVRFLGVLKLEGFGMNGIWQYHCLNVILQGFGVPPPTPGGGSRVGPRSKSLAPNSSRMGQEMFQNFLE